MNKKNHMMKATWKLHPNQLTNQLICKAHLCPLSLGCTLSLVSSGHPPGNQGEEYSASIQTALRYDSQGVQ